MTRLAQQSNARRRRVRDHNAAWAKGDAWKDTRGGFNPDVFKDLDEGTRQRLRDHQVGPSILRGDKVSATTAFNTGQWGDGVHGDAGAIDHIYWGGEKGSKRAHNRGNVQQAVWETGLSNIGDKDQLNQFLDRADSVKAKHGDFLKDGWTPEAIMLMRDQPQQAPAPTPAPVAKEPVAKPDLTPAEDSDHLKKAKELAQGWEQKKEDEQGTVQTTYDQRPTTQAEDEKEYDFTSQPSTFTKPTVNGDTKNV